MAFKSAKNYQRHLRMALMGPAKSGKSYTALSIAHALAGEGGKVAVIDTENASAAKYAESFPPFDVSELERYDPDDYVREILEAEKLGYDCVIVDSISHAWNGPGGLLEFKHKLANSGKKGMNEWTAWADATPKHTRLMYFLTHVKMHVIVTFRTKVEYVLDNNNKPVRVGLAPIQREDAEYEFDILGMMDRTHTLSIEGSRCGGLDNAVIPVPSGHQVAEPIKQWLAGEPMPELTSRQKEMRDLLNDFYHVAPKLYSRIPNWEEAALKAALKLPDDSSMPEDYTLEDIELMKAYIESKKAAKQQKQPVEAKAS